MLKEPTHVVREEDVHLPAVSLGRSVRKAPSFTDEEIWHFAGDRGVFSHSPAYFKFAFDTLVHREGVLLYRMKPRSEWFVKIQPANGDDVASLFGGVVFHDAMERFITRECGNSSKDDLVVMSTHGLDGEEYDEIENECTVPFERFQKYLDLNTSFEEFRAELKKYKDERDAEWDALLCEQPQLCTQPPQLCEQPPQWCGTQWCEQPFLLDAESSETAQKKQKTDE